MIVDNDVNRVRVEEIGFDVIDKEHVGYARQFVIAAPVLAAVFADLNESIVSSSVNKSLDKWRFRQRCDVAVHRHRRKIPWLVVTPDPAHHGFGNSIDSTREVAADRPPGVSAIVAAPDALTRKIKTRGIVRTDQYRRVPVPAFHRFAFLRLRLDIDSFPDTTIESVQNTLLRLGVDDIGIGGIRGRLMAVATERDEPVGVGDAVHVQRPGRATLAAVVLSTAINVVERFVIVDRDFIKLRNGEVGDETPVLAKVQALVKPSVIADQQIVLVIRVEGDCVVVDMFILIFSLNEVLAAIHRVMQVHVRVIQAIELVRACPDLLVIVRAGAAGDIFALLFPGLATIFRFPDPAGTQFEFDSRVKNVRIDR